MTVKDCLETIARLKDSRGTFGEFRIAIEDLTLAIQDTSQPIGNDVFDSLDESFRREVIGGYTVQLRRWFDAQIAIMSDEVRRN